MREFLNGFRYAFIGLSLAWKRGLNFKIQVFCALGAAVLGVVLPLSAVELSLVALAIALVLGAETFNTAFEEFCDKFRPEHDPHIARIKDLAAAAVLIMAAGALAVGVIIFAPYLL